MSPLELVGPVFVAVPVLLIAGVVIAILLLSSHRRKVLFEGVQRLAARDGLQLTDTPCGLDRRQYADRFEATPRGDRRYGLRYGVQGPLTVDLDGRPVTVDLACFQWWYEIRSQSNDRTSYQERSNTVATVRLPVVVPGRIQIEPEGILGRVGLRRADQQLESEEFNRRFRVTGSDPRLTITFLDAAMQHRLLTNATNRTIHLEHDLLLLGGKPSHRDPSFPGVVAEFPAVAQDIAGLLREVPAQVWRAASPGPGAGP